MFAYPHPGYRRDAQTDFSQMRISLVPQTEVVLGLLTCEESDYPGVLGLDPGSPTLRV